MMWLPPKVSRELVDGRREFEAELRDRMVRAHMMKTKGVLDEFNYELKRIDPKLELVRAGESTHGTPLIPGFYAVIRWNEGAPPSVMNVTGPNGEFVEPSSAIFEQLKAQDLWDPQNMRLLRQREALAEQSAAKLKARETEDRQAEILERWQAGTRTFVSMNRDTPWSQNASSNGRRDAGQRKVAGRRGAKH